MNGEKNTNQKENINTQFYIIGLLLMILAAFMPPETFVLRIINILFGFGFVIYSFIQDQKIINEELKEEFEEAKREEEVDYSEAFAELFKITEQYRHKATLERVDKLISEIKK